MNHVEIDRRLALAIGYAPDRIKHDIETNDVYVLNNWWRLDGPQRCEGLQRFDHTNPDVIWPIAERFDAFPYTLSRKSKKPVWNAFIRCDSRCEKQSACAATASALAVIKFVEAGKS